jgi:spore coat polysaccharide biosynthesis protein SpsF
MKTVALLQARCSSSRLPNKVLAPIVGEPMLARQIERVRRAKTLDALAVITSVAPDDDAIESLCRVLRLDCFRGSLDDVLDRFFQAAREFDATDVVRLTGDCPLADPEIIDMVVRTHHDSGADFTSNALQATFPDGLDVEVMRFSALEWAWREARKKSEREHVTVAIYEHTERFSVKSVVQSEDQSAMRWVVDNPEDLVFVRSVYDSLYPQKPDFTSSDVLDLLRRHPELADVNRHIQRNEGWLKSLAEDEVAGS